MKYIKLLFAASHDEFENELKELGDYIRSLNDIYVKRGIYFETDVNEEDTQYFYVILGNQADEDMVKSFDVAFERFCETEEPHIYTYFYKFQDGENKAQSIMDFVKKLEEKIGHYYSKFEHLDSVKLNILLEMTRDLNVGTQLKFEDGKAILDGLEVLELANIPIYSGNEDLTRCKEELCRLNEEYAKLRLENKTNPDDDDIYEKCVAVSGKRKELAEQIHQMEMDILNLCTTISKLDTSDRKLTWREIKAKEFFDEGNYDSALDILRDEQRELELMQAEEIIENGMERVRGYISENRLRISALKSKGITKNTIPEIRECYEKNVKLAKKYDIELEELYEYASFLLYQRDYDESYTLAKYLESHYENDETVEDYDVARLKNLMGLVLKCLNKYEEAEKYCKESLEIRRRLAEENAEAYELDVADTCNNLGSLYYYTKKYKEAEKYYRDSLEILRRLVEGNVELYESGVANICNNIGNLYSDLNKYKEAEKYYRDSLGILRRLAEGNAELYEPDVANICNNIANLYKNLGEYEYAEKYYREALEIRRRLAEGNAEAYKPDVAIICNNLGAMYNVLDEYKEAEKYYKEALEVYRRLAEENADAYEPYIAGICNNLGVLYSNLDEDEEAEKYLKESMQGYRLLAEGNAEAYEPDVANACNNFGNLYSDLGKYEEAEKYYREALEIRRRLAEGNAEAYEPYLAEVCISLGVLYDELKKYEEVEKYYKEALEIRKSLSKQSDGYQAEMAEDYYRLGSFLGCIQRYEEAEIYYKEALSIYKRLADVNMTEYETEIADICDTLNLLKKLHVATADPMEICKQYIEEHHKKTTEKPIISSEKPALFQTKLKIRDSILNIFRKPTNKEKYEVLEVHYKNLLDKYSELKKENEEEYALKIAGVINLQGKLFYYMRRYEECEEKYNSSLEMYKSFLGGERVDKLKPLIAYLYNDFANLYHKTRKYEKSEKYYLKAKEIYVELSRKDFDTYDAAVKLVETNIMKLKKSYFGIRF